YRDADTGSGLTRDTELKFFAEEAGSWVVIGNGYAPFLISMPILAGDAAYGIWPFGVHGGGHPEGHPGWDIAYVPGAKARAAADGTVSHINPNPHHPGTWFISVQHRPGYFTWYNNLGGVEPGIVVGTPVRAGDPLGAPMEIPDGDSSFFVIHFAVNVNSQTMCPEDYLNAGGHSLFDGMWRTAAYGEELTEPLPCNPLAVTFPLTRTWLRASGPLAPKIEFTRLDPTTSAYTYRLLDAGGIVLESGAVNWFNPRALPYSTIDLLPSGERAPHLGIYDIVSGTMRIIWDDAVRPTDLTGASVYTLAP
ncbi:MAG: M23 family metallopeptidase, partial [Nitrospirota bacterium]